jgi:DNA-binding transcriptional MocR family regulator
LQLEHASADELAHTEQQLAEAYQSILKQNLKLDLTRGKPSAEQLSLSDALDGILDGDYRSANGTDVRNYGGIDGLAEIKQLGAEVLGVQNNEILAGGNSSLSLMFQAMTHAVQFGFNGADSAWKNTEGARFLCPVPGYDRHFTVCEQLGLEMIPVAMTASGPDMDQVERLVAEDSRIKGMWCVPKYSNPTGVIYSDETVERIAKLGQIAAQDFKVFWDNAYAVHDLNAHAQSLAPIMDYCRQHQTEDSVLQFASTSKITHAGAGVAFMAASPANLASFKKVLGASTIGPDKINQLRHARFLPNLNALSAHMQKHAAIIKPRFACVLKHLGEAFGDNDLGEWESAEGGYFISFDAKPGLAKQIVQLAKDAGVVLTPAGATFPYGNDPLDRNIRIAPTVPTVEEVEAAMNVFVVCVKLASVRQALEK